MARLPTKAERAKQSTELKARALPNYEPGDRVTVTWGGDKHKCVVIECWNYFRFCSVVVVEINGERVKVAGDRVRSRK